MLVLTKKMLNCYPDGFQSFMVTGRRGIGKTSYSLRALHDVYLTLDYDDDVAWDLALECLKFSIPDVVDYLRLAMDHNERKLALLWDDVRVHASGSQYFLQMKLVTQLGGLLDVIRTSVNCVILTCPSPKGLLSILGSYDDFLIQIHYSERGGYNRNASGYLWSTLPSGQKRVYKKFEDHYSCRLPNKVYKKYMGMRRKALEYVLVELEKTVKE